MLLCILDENSKLGVASVWTMLIKKRYNWQTILSPPHYRNGVHHPVEIIRSGIYCGGHRDVSECIYSLYSWSESSIYTSCHHLVCTRSPFWIRIASRVRFRNSLHLFELKNYENMNAATIQPETVKTHLELFNRIWSNRARELFDQMNLDGHTHTI